MTFQPAREMTVEKNRIMVKNHEQYRERVNRNNHSHDVRNRGHKMK